MRQTHTFVVLDLSPTAFREIHAKLEAAGYSHAFLGSEGREVIDMAGIAVASESRPERKTVRQYKQAHKSLVGLTIPDRATSA
jgi:hypothetical protein